MLPLDLKEQPAILRLLARALMTGEQEERSAAGRLEAAVGKRWRSLPGLAERYLEAFAGRKRPGVQDVVEFLLGDTGFRRVRHRLFYGVPSRSWVTEPDGMRPVAAAAGWEIPAIDSVGGLADWLGITPWDLEWFADRKGLCRRWPDSPLHHYLYRVVAKRSGDFRLIEAPKPRLKTLQKLILTEILDRIPAHTAAHGFVRGRSTKSFAAPHVGQRVVLRMDLRDFFPSIFSGRVQAFFRMAGYPDEVSSFLAGICTNAVADTVWTPHRLRIGVERAFELRRQYGGRHLPQGAPTSPALANFCAYRLDCRLTGLATAAGAVYTRYADDLAFSGGENFGRRVDRFADHVGAIVLEEGFEAHYRKTRVMRAGVRQALAGLVVTERLNVSRAEFDGLKATLTNCVRMGPEGQNRDGVADFRAHLLGRVGFVESVNAARGAKLRGLFERIVW